MWRYASVINYKVDDADYSTLTNARTSLLHKLPNNLLIQIPYWAYTLHAQLEYSQLPDGIPVQGVTYHSVAAVQVPVADTRVADLQLSYAFENTESDEDSDARGDGEIGGEIGGNCGEIGGKSRYKQKSRPPTRQKAHSSQQELQQQVTQKLRERVQEECPRDGIAFEEVTNFELGYLRYLYHEGRATDVDRICREVAHEPLFKGAVHPVRRYLLELCAQVQHALTDERKDISLEQQFLTAFYKANPQLVNQIADLEKLDIAGQKERLKEHMKAEHYNMLEQRMADYISQHGQNK